MPSLLQRMLQAKMQTAAASLTVVSNQAHLPREFWLKLEVKFLSLFIIGEKIKALFTRQIAPYVHLGNNLNLGLGLML